MYGFVKRFLQEEDGAVTADWVVLTASIVALAVLLIGQMGENATGVAGAIRDYMSGWTFN